MSRRTHYSPCISRRIVGALYHEAKRRRLPMTRLVDELLTGCLHDTPAWQSASATTTRAMQEPPHGDRITR